MKTTVFLADKSELLRKQLRTLLGKIPDLEVVGEAEAGQTVVEQVKILQPDLLLMNISLSGMNGIEALRKIHSNNPDQAVIIVSWYDEIDYLQSARAAGAKGYLLKTQVVEELEAAVRIVLQGGVYLSRGIEPTP